MFHFYNKAKSLFIPVIVKVFVLKIVLNVLLQNKNSMKTVCFVSVYIYIDMLSVIFL